MPKRLRLLKLANGEYRPGTGPSIPEIEIEYVEGANSSQSTKMKEVVLESKLTDFARLKAIHKQHLGIISLRK